MRRWARAAQLDDDAGLTTVEFTIAFAALMFAIFAGFQIALYAHARNVALAAAQEGVQVARVDGSSTAAGLLGPASFSPRPAVTRSCSAARCSPPRPPSRVRVAVTGQSISVLPGVPGLPISQTAAGPIERFTSRTAP